MSIKTPAPPVTTAQPPVPSLAPADFFSAAEARIDQWRQLSAVARAWQAAATRGASEDALFAEAVALFGEWRRSRRSSPIRVRGCWARSNRRSRNAMPAFAPGWCSTSPRRC